MLTLRQENACLAYVELGQKSDAYRRAYSASKMSTATINKRANELFDLPAMIARVAELRAPIIERHNITVDDLITELDENRRAALMAETVQSSAATAATMAKAKLLGYLQDKIELTGRNGAPVQTVNNNVAISPEKYAEIVKSALDKV